MQRWPLIVNPSSGGGKGQAVQGLLESFCQENGGELLYTEQSGQATVLARQAVESGAELLLVGGGDDTVREVLAGILHREHPPELGILPLGTFNNFARTLGLPIDPAAALEVAFGGHPVPVDLGQVNRERIFTESVGVGFQAEAWLHKPEVEPVGLRRLLQGASIALETLGGFEPKLFHLTIDEAEEMVRAMDITVANTPEFASAMTAAPYASVSDGKLDVCVIRELGMLEFLASVPLIFTGLHPYLMTSVEYHQGCLIEISGGGDRPAPVRVDSSIDLRLPVTIEVLPGRITVRVPQTQWP